MTRKPSAVQSFIHRFLAVRPVSFLLSKILHHADAFLLRLTGGRHTFAELVGLPIGKLTTLGAKSGKPRSTTLVSVPDGDKFALIATNFGQKLNPSWYYNLKAHPECQIFFDGRCENYIAREAQGEEYDRYWQLARSYYAGYDKYKQRAAPRRIPVLVLESKKSK